MTDLRRLTDRQREVLILRCGEDLTVDEAADRLGIGLKAVKEHQTNARRALGKKHLGGCCFVLGLRGAELLGAREEGDDGRR